jgi:hypothetical protein
MPEEAVAGAGDHGGLRSEAGAVDTEAAVGGEGFEELGGGEDRVARLEGGEQEVEEGRGTAVAPQRFVEVLEDRGPEAQDHRLEGPREVALAASEREEGVEHQVLDLPVPRANAVERRQDLERAVGLGAPQVGPTDLAPGGVLVGVGVAVGEGVGEGHRGSPFRVRFEIEIPARGLPLLGGQTVPRSGRKSWIGREIGAGHGGKIAPRRLRWLADV